jgi:outer membrane murein-binding lipoprotein Lpp
MKKLVLFAAVALSMSVFSCGNGEKGEAVDSDSVAVEAPVDTVAQPDTAAVDTAAVAAAQAE